MKKIIDWVKWYRNSGINIFPLREKEKVPLVPWEEFKSRETTEEEQTRWLVGGIKNFGAVCGPISGDLLVIDVDRKELFTKLSLGKLASGTFTVKTGKGYHIYLYMPDPKKKGLTWEGHEEIRFQGEGKYVVCAGSIHPNGMVYEHLSLSPLEIKKADRTILDEIEHRWKKYHGIDKIEEKREEVNQKTKRSNLLEDFKKRISLTDVIARYVSKAKDYGTYWQGHCPFHHDRTPSFTVYEGTGSYYCFGCEKGGDVITFVMEKEGLGFIEAVREIEKQTGVGYFQIAKNKGPNKEGGYEIKIKKIDPYPIEVVKLIVSVHSFATLRDTEEVLHYENGMGGAWRFNGKVVIKEESEKILEEFGGKNKPTLHFVNEVVGHIQRSTYIDREQLNTEKKKINLINGVYDLESEQLLPFDSSYYFTSLVPVEYDADAKCPKIEKFMREILYEDDIKTVLQFIGYCLLPIMPYHKAMMFLGDGANGKSTLIELIKRFLGAKNTTNHSLQSITENRFITADLYGKLANLYADIPKDALRHTGTFKVLTGGDTLSAERKFKEPFSFKNTAKLIFSGNVLPEAMDDTEAFFRRWLLVTFPNTFEGDQCDPWILEKLTTAEELSGFFNLVLDALKQLMRDGRFHKSKPATEIREEYIDKSSPVLSFVTKCLESDPNSFETKDDVYSAFIKFCKERKLPEVAKNVFSAHLPRHAIVKAGKKRIAGKLTKCWRGIRLKEAGELRETFLTKAKPEAKAFSCEACGAKFENTPEFDLHRSQCCDFQMSQARERRKEGEDE